MDTRATRVSFNPHRQSLSVPPSPSQPVHSVGLEPFLLRARWLPPPARLRLIETG
jgi:hypothetical protein